MDGGSIQVCRVVHNGTRLIRMFVRGRRGREIIEAELSEQGRDGGCGTT